MKEEGNKWNKDEKICKEYPECYCEALQVNKLNIKKIKDFLQWTNCLYEARRTVRNTRWLQQDITGG